MPTNDTNVVAAPAGTQKGGAHKHGRTGRPGDDRRDHGAHQPSKAAAPASGAVDRIVQPASSDAAGTAPSGAVADAPAATDGGGPSDGRSSKGPRENGHSTGGGNGHSGHG